MKITILIKQIIFLIFLHTLAFSQSNWIWQNPSPTGNDLLNFQFTDLNTGYSIGYDFTFLKTTNAGEDWSLKYMDIDTISSVQSGNLKGIYFINSLTGYVGGDGIFKTTNGGETWSYQNTEANVNSIYFTDASTGFAACDSGKIVKTIDGGNSWFLSYSIGNISINFYKIDFTSPNTGFVVGESRTILKTTDHGNTWVLKNGPLSFSFVDFNFVNSSTGFASGGYGRLAKTTDEGESWITIQLPFSGNFNSIYFVSSQTGYLVSNSYPVPPDYTSQGKIYMTTDGGNQWSLLINLGIHIYKISFFNSNNAFITCEGGGIFETTNSGLSWSQRNKTYSNSNLTSVCFISNNLGFIAGSNSLAIKTTNGGMEWHNINPPVNENFSYIEFFDRNNGYLAGDYLYKTSNSGLSWDKLIMLRGYQYMHTRFQNLDTGYYLRNDILYKTFNRGENWISNPTAGAAQRFFFMDNNDTGFIICSYSVGTIYDNYNDIYRTINNGLSWSRTNIFHNGMFGGFLEYIHFINSETGFLSGTPGIKKTTNAGALWIPYSGLIGLTSDFFFYKNVGYISSSNNVYKTTNTGNNWIQIFSTSKNLNSYFFTDVNTGYAVGQFGYILKTTNGGGINVNISEENMNTPHTFNLYQNYPNPFNPVTKIEFDLTTNNKVKLTVYNVLGKIINTIVNTDLSEGRYKYNFDGSNLSSGIYFYRLETENFSQTKRMVLIK